jgi:hypothetical protein
VAFGFILIGGYLLIGSPSGRGGNMPGAPEDCLFDQQISKKHECSIDKSYSPVKGKIIFCMKSFPDESLTFFIF